MNAAVDHTGSHVRTALGLHCAACAIRLLGAIDDGLGFGDAGTRLFEHTPLLAQGFVCRTAILVGGLIPPEVITGWLGPESGWLGVLAATVAGAATPGGPVIGFSIAAVALKVGGGTPQVIAYVISWALFAFQRLILWEIPFMPAKFVWFRAAVSLPFPLLAAALSMAIGKP